MEAGDEGLSRHIVPGRDVDHLPIEQQLTHWDIEKDAAKPRASCKRFDIPDELMTERATRLWLKFR